MDIVVPLFFFLVVAVPGVIYAVTGYREPKSIDASLRDVGLTWLILCGLIVLYSLFRSGTWRWDLVLALTVGSIGRLAIDWLVLRHRRSQEA